MKSISRYHNFENGITYVNRDEKYLYGHFEKGEFPLKMKRSKKLDQAFEDEDWDYLIEEFFNQSMDIGWQK